MSTIDPPRTRILAARQALTWEFPGNAIIDGKVADYASIAGGETVTIGVGAAAPVLITMVAGDVTAALVRDRINATHAGLASVVNGHLRLSDAARVRVTATSNYARIGLPIVDADAAAPFTSLALPVVIEFDRLDLMTAAMTIPTGANVATIWIDDVTLFDQFARVFAAFGNGTDGAVTSSLIEAIGELLYKAPETISEFSERACSGEVLQIRHGISSVSVPLGATTMRLVVFDDSNAGADEVRPTIGGGVIFGCQE